MGRRTCDGRDPPVRPQPAAHRPRPRTSAMFRATVREFAEQRVRPLVRKMDEESRIPRELIDACFELGLMGIEIPEKHGGSGAHVLHVDPRGRGAGARRPVARGARRRAEHARQQRDPALRATKRSRRSTSRSWPRSGWAPTRSARRARARTPSRSPAAPRTRATTTCSPAASSGSRTRAEAELFIVMANARSREGLQGHHELPGREDVPRLHGRQEGGQARDPRLARPAS